MRHGSDIQSDLSLVMRQILALISLLLFIEGNISAQSNISSPQIQIIPNKALIDENVSIQLTGFQPGQHIVLRVKATDDLNKKWESYAEFQADENGRVNIGSQKPLSGTYNEADSTGLFWSMKLMSEEQTSLFAKSTLTPLEFSFSVEVENTVVTSATLERLFISKEVIRIPVRENGLAGVLFLPDSSHIHPGVITIGGSEGGLNESTAALLASRGYAAFALAYFNYEHLPAGLVNIPLEYFKTAIHWMQKQRNINAKKIGFMGTSRGAEATLLAASHFPEIKAVVVKVPSAVVWEGVWGEFAADITYPSWTYNGIPLPIMRSSTPAEKQKVLEKEPLVQVNRFLVRLSEKNEIKKAIIPVEKIKAPILLISAQDDHLWPSTLMSEMIVKGLQEYHFPYKVQHLSYKGSGHRIWIPNLPTTVTVTMHPVRKKMTSLGGNARDNAWAASDSWSHVLKFLGENLR